MVYIMLRRRYSIFILAENEETNRVNKLMQSGG